MTTNTKREVLHLDRIPVERDAVKIGDAEYELKALSDLSIIDRAQLKPFWQDHCRLRRKGSSRRGGS